MKKNQELQKKKWSSKLKIGNFFAKKYTNRGLQFLDLIQEEILA